MPDLSLDDAPALLAPAALARHLGEGGLRVVDIRSDAPGGRGGFEAGHVPGAVHSDYARDGWRTRVGAAAGLLPEPDALSALFGRLGMRPDAWVVIVPAGLEAGDFSAAARVFWTLRMAGHRRLSILDGGHAGWAAGGYPVETGPGSRPEPTDYPVALRPRGRASLADVETAISAGGPTLLDARGPASFAGAETSPQAARAGRLPGALLLEGARFFDPARGGLRAPEELARLSDAVPGGPVVAYCNTGQAAATNWFVLSELLGRPDIALYDGSMSEWTADPARPVETGASEAPDGCASEAPDGGPVP